MCVWGGGYDFHQPPVLILYLYDLYTLRAVIKIKKLIRNIQKTFIRNPSRNIDFHNFDIALYIVVFPFGIFRRGQHPAHFSATQNVS